MPPHLLIGQSRKARMRDLVRKAAIIVGAAGLCLLLTYTAFRRWTMLPAPEDAGPPLPPSAQVDTRGGVTRAMVGESWMDWRDGIWRIHLSGDPRLMGHSHGLLAGPVTVSIERHLQGLMQGYVTSPWRRWLLENAVRWRYRQLPENLPPDRLIELAAFSRTMLELDELGQQPFQRLVYYHALHDMTQRMDGSPLIGCSAFAVWGKQAAGGHLIVGRNFDFEGGSIFDHEKAIIAYHTPGKIPFVSVAWPGMMGVVTGVNAKKLYVSLNAARTDDPMQPGIPMAFLLREVLEGAGTIKEALEIIKHYQVMVPEALLLADGNKPEAVVVELSPRSLAVRRTRGPEAIAVTNHFLDPKYAGDASNNWLRRYTTSEARYQRLVQLLKRFGGRIDVRTAALILRNRTAIDDEPLGLGNRNALDALIATHSVVLDLSDMVLWVSQGPNLLGPYVPVDLKPMFSIPLAAVAQPEPIPADPLRESPELAQHQMAKRELELAKELVRSDRSRALEYAARAARTQPDLPEAHKLIGDLLWRDGHREEAKQAYRTFLKLRPPYLREVEEVTTLLSR